MDLQALVAQQAAAQQAAAEKLAADTARNEKWLAEGQAIVDALKLDSEKSDKRVTLVGRAASLGADATALKAILEAVRVAASATIQLPKHRFTTLSRGKGWCLSGGRGAGEFIEDYVVGPGEYRCGGSDGFARKETIAWKVTHVAVGDEVWTLAE